MNYNYVRSTRPIGKYDRPKKQPPKTKTDPYILKFLSSIVNNIHEKNLEHSFMNIKRYVIVLKNKQNKNKIAIENLQKIIKRIQDKKNIQCFFMIKNFKQKQDKSFIDENKKQSVVQPLDASNSILWGINYMPFRKGTKKEQNKKALLLSQGSYKIASAILGQLILKQQRKSFKIIKYQVLLTNKSVNQGLQLIKNVVNPRLLNSWLKLRYFTNRLYLEPRQQQQQKFRTLVAIKSQMTVEAERRNVLKGGIDRQKAYRDNFILIRQKDLRQKDQQLQTNYSEQSDSLRTTIYRQQQYIDNVLNYQQNQQHQNPTNYFKKLQSIYIDLISSNSNTISKQEFIKKYTIDGIPSNIQLLLQNMTLWQKVKLFEQIIGFSQSQSSKQQIKSSNSQLSFENNQVKQTIAFYIKQQYVYSHQHSKQLDNINIQLNQMQSKILSNKVQVIKTLFI